MAEPPKPILFVAFANDVEDPARNLAGLHGEFANIKAAFASVTGADDSCELLAHEGCTGEGLVEPFYRNQVVIFHYAGHASPDSLLLQTVDGHNAPASRQRFEDFLALQSRLRLVFLNACMTRDWAAALVEHGVCVVATSRCIEDSIAPRFARNFYNQIAQGRTIAEAFEVVSKGCASAEEHQLALRGVAAAENDHATDGLPWALYGSETAKRWRLSDDADDPTIGLPPLDLDSYPPPPGGPYVSILGHQAEHARVFFGRNAEIRQLYDWVTKPTATPVLLFYGQSGAGKSSLLRAGLQPRLDSVARVQYVRRATDLCADLETAIAATSDKDAEWVGSKEPNLIVLDQVEEALTQGPKGELAALGDRLAALFSQRPPGSSARLILSFRKEYLAEIGNLLREKLPGLTTELFLERLSPKAVRQVVLGPVRSELLRSAYHLKISETFAEFLAVKLEDKRGSVAMVLQIVLRRMWEKGRKAASDGSIEPLEFDETLYSRVIDDEHGPLKQFLDEQIKELQKKWPSEVEGGLELDLLLEHTTDHMTARRRTLKKLKAFYPERETLRQLVEENKRLHLLSEAQEDGSEAQEEGSETQEDGSETQEDGRVTRATTLAHDQLAMVVRADWNLSQLAGARARRIVENRARTWGDKKRGDLLDGGDLRVVERGLEQMRALNDENHENEMLAASRERRRKRRQAWIVWPTVTAIVVGGVLGLALANQSARDRIHSLNQRAAQELAANNPGADAFVSLLLSMEAVREARNSWVFRLSPDRDARDAARATLQASLAAPHDSGRYEFDYRYAFGDLSACATAFDDSGRLLLRTFADRGTDIRIRKVSVGGRRIPDDMVDPDQPLDQPLESGCDPLNRRFGVLGLEGPRLWQDGAERNVKLDWIFDLGQATRMALSPDGHSAAFGSTGFLPEGSAKTDMSWVVLANMDTGKSVEIHPNAGIPVGLAFSPDFSLLAVTGPKAMVWLDATTGRNVLRCPGNYGAVGFARVGGQEFAAVINMTSPNWPSVEFWKLPLSANPGMTQCQPFDFYQPTDYSGHTDDRLTAIAFDKSGMHFAVGSREDEGTVDPDNNATSVVFYAVPSSLSGNVPPDPRHTHPFPMENIACTGCPPPRPAGEMHEFPHPIASFYLPTTGDSNERPLKADIVAIGVNGDRSTFAFLQDGSPVVRVWPAQQQNLSRPLSADNLFSIACSELNVYLSEDDGFRVNPAAGEGVNLHVLQAGCGKMPQLHGTMAH
jgi:hypothetical protein